MNDIEHKAHDEQVAAIRQWGPRLARAIIVLAFVFAVVFVKLWKDQQGTVDELKTRAVLGCHRTNVERASQNKQNFADYSFFTLILALSPKPQPAKEPPKQRERTAEILASFHSDINAKTYVPLNYCTGHAASRAIYRPPSAISFASVFGKPPKTAFEVRKGQ